MIPLAVLGGARHSAGLSIARQPVQFYNLGDPASYPGTGNTVYDLSGAGDHATVYGSPTYSASGGYFQMGYKDSFGSLNEPYTTAFTATVVFYLDKYISGQFGSSLIGSSVGIGSSGTRGSWVYVVSPGQLIVEAFNGTPTYTSASGVIGLNQWVAVTVALQRGGASSVYINRAKHTDLTSSTENSAKKITFGDLRPTRGLGIEGRISAGVVYDYLLSESEVLNNHDLLLNQVGA